MRRISTLLFIVFNSFGYSQGIETDRPDQTESSSTIPKGTLQIETGIGVEVRQSDVFGPINQQRNFLLPTSLFRIALVNHLELRIVNNVRVSKFYGFMGTENVLGIDDLEVGFKAQVLNGDGLKPQVSLISHLIVPTGTNSSGRYGSVSKLSLSHEFSNGMGIGYNLGYGYYGYGNGDFLYSLALGFPIAEKLSVYVEGYGSYAEMKFFDVNGDAGITYLLKENIQLDYSFGVGITAQMNYQAIGCSIRIPN